MSLQAKGSISILNEIAGRTRLRVARSKELLPFEGIKKKALALADGNRQRVSDSSLTPFFEKQLKAQGLSFICEVKKASPSKGIIAKDFAYLEIAKEYEAAGASAISVLTEPEYFLGADQYLSEIAEAVQIPVLRKDFIVDSYQIYEAKLLKAGAVLLICAILDASALASFVKIAGELNLSALVEIHDEAEAEMALNTGAKIIGINNRDLRTFKVDFELSARLRNILPPQILAVAESGVKSKDDIRCIKDMNFDAVLIGESLMKAADKKQFLAELKAAAGETA
jgi:indole-3-glycerol phosphate synthase